MDSRAWCHLSYDNTKKSQRARRTYAKLCETGKAFRNSQVTEEEVRARQFAVRRKTVREPTKDDSWTNRRAASLSYDHGCDGMIARCKLELQAAAPWSAH